MTLCPQTAPHVLDLSQGRGWDPSPLPPSALIIFCNHKSGYPPDGGTGDGGASAGPILSTG